MVARSEPAASVRDGGGFRTFGFVAPVAEGGAHMIHTPAAAPSRRPSPTRLARARRACAWLVKPRFRWTRRLLQGAAELSACSGPRCVCRTGTVACTSTVTELTLLLADGVRTASLATASRDMLRHRPTSFTVHQCRVVSASAWLRRESVGIGHAGIDNTAHMHYVWL